MTLDKNIKRKYYLQNYDPNWVKKFDSIKLFLQSVFGDKALKIEHVGSTSIPNMKAKPIIDILVVVEKMEEFLEQREKMISAGYEWGENYIAPNTQLFFKMAQDGSKTENIHICEIGAPKEKQFLVMRDFFRSFPEKAKEYSDLKEKNFALNPDDYPAYREAKAPFLAKMEQEAYEWYGSKIFSSYNPQWPQKFETEARKIRDILGTEILDIQHIGSTSIPNLSAKPIIDIGVLVNSIDDIQSFVSKISTLGYEYKPDMSSVERIFLRKGNPIEYHLSIACPKHTFWKRNITFCEYLRTHPEFVKEYEELKRQNLSLTPESDFDDLSRSKTYNNGKGDFVQKILDLAETEK
jgi:GrpB-like predicted nucleotidyltransferase (UPF0157 family)